MVGFGGGGTVVIVIEFDGGELQFPFVLVTKNVPGEVTIIC